LSGSDGGVTQATEVACALVGGAVAVSRLSSAGRNSRIWRVRNGEHTFALKQYPSKKDDTRDRLSTEVGALRLMERCAINTVPRVLGIDDARGYALLSWIDGLDVIDVSNADIDAAVDFLSAVHGLRSTPWAKQQPSAAEACLSGGEIERQIGERIARLRAVAGGGHELIEFINNSVVTRLESESANARRKAMSAGLAFDAELPQEWRSLVPSDFGFHNCLRKQDGSLAFLDFEYFGWDDPVKLTADILLHPGRPLLPPQRARFRQAAVRLYGSDAVFANRLAAYLPLFGLRWVLILLNEFIPERWQRRVLAGEAGSWGDVKARQLAHARKFLAALPEKLEQ
jgi:aminoglycoside phosphotransferase (APT) family kinase protein